jgi:hypothetical protein
MWGDFFTISVLAATFGSAIRLAGAAFSTSASTASC